VASVQLPLSNTKRRNTKGQVSAPFFRLRFLGGTFALLVAACLFAPGASGPFIFDDGPNLTDSQAFIESTRDCLALEAPGLISPSGPLGRPVAMFSFALNHCLSGFDPVAFKGTNIALHALSAAMLMLLVGRVMQTPRFLPWRRELPFVDHLPLLVAVGWLVSPLHVSTVLYVVQRMTILSALFSLLGMYCYVSARLHALAGSRPRIIVTYAACALLCLPLAAFSKENGLLLPLMCVVLEFSCFDARDRSPRVKRALPGVLIGGGLLAALGVAMLWPQIDAWLGRLYAFRDFTLAERLATQTAVLFWYARMTIAPDLAAVGLFHDDFPILDPWSDPTPWLLGLAWTGLVGLAFALRQRLPFLLPGLGLFLAGHAMESSFLPLEMVFEHRNYLPSIGIVLALVLLLSTILVKRPRLLAACMTGWLVVGGAATMVRATDWADNFDLHAREIQKHSGSERAAVVMGGLLQDVYSQQGEESTGEASLAFFEQALSLNPDGLPALFGRLSILSEMRRPTDSAYEAVLARLKEPGLHPVTSASIGLFFDLALAGRTSLDGLQLVTLAAAVLENPTAVPATRRDIAYRLALFYANSHGDIDAALRVLDATGEPVDDPFSLELLRQQLLAASADPSASAHLDKLQAQADASPWPWERARRHALLRALERRASP
jgi:protein O-mannosyl-transferase